MMFIVDGTGESDVGRYDREMSNGFCRLLEKESGGIYWRGPTEYDGPFGDRRTTDIAKEVIDAILTWNRLPAIREKKLFLAGHSRGGAAVIFAAQEILKQGIDVEAMFLFDAVDRSFTTRRAKVIPRNVRHCHHALRDTSLAFELSDEVAATRDEVARLLGLPTGRRPMVVEDALDAAMKGYPMDASAVGKAIRKAKDAVEQDQKAKLVTRAVTMNTVDGWTADFGNCGLEGESPANVLEMQVFPGSHGAIGGAPIIDERAPRGLIERDRKAMKAVKSWMWARLLQYPALKRT